MPELPDVENYRRYLVRHALKRRIASVRVNDAVVVRGFSRQALTTKPKGHAITKTERRGKQLFAKLGDDGWLAMHFGMTGRLEYVRDGSDEPKFDRVRFDLANGDRLAFVDGRKLGRIGWIEDPDVFIERHKLGPDALDPKLTRKRFDALLAERRGKLKSTLMDQKFIAGIGNVYADEILFQARLHPETAVQALDAKARGRLYSAMRKVLKTAIAKGAGSERLFERLPKTYLIPRRKAGADCPRCGGKVKQIQAAGRSTYFCPRCQQR